MIEIYPQLAEEPEGCAAPRIVHGRDLIVEGGRLEQDYNFIDYFFGVEIDDQKLYARHYLDEPGQVTIRARFEQVADKPWFPPILAYLQYRFDKIDVPGPGGSETRWKVDPIASSEA